MLALIAIAVLAPLLYIPGFLIERAVRGGGRTHDPLERHFERTILGALLNGWLALTLAEIGIFANWLHLLLLTLGCGGAAWAAYRRGAMMLPRSLDYLDGRRKTEDESLYLPPSSFVFRLPSHRDNSNAAIGQRLQVINWQTAATLVLGVITLLLVSRPFEVILGVRDAGFYSNTGFAIAQHGGIIQHDEIIAGIGADTQSSDPELAAAAAQTETNFLSKQDKERYLWTGIRAAGFFFEREQITDGAVYPQGFHLFPAWIGLLTSLLGREGGLLATGLMGFLGVWSVGMVGRRLGGPWVGLLAALLLALNGVQVWFSRYSTTETTAQFLTFAGIWAFSSYQLSAISQQPTTGRQQPTTDNRQPTIDNGQLSTLHALIAGLAFGQWALVRIEFFLVIAPVLAYLVYTWLTRRWQRAHSVFAIALGAMLVQAALHIAFISRGYFFDTLWARLQDKSAIVAALTLPFLNDTIRDIYLTTPRSLINFLAKGPERHSPVRLIVEIAAAIGLVIGLVLLRRWQTPLRRFEALVGRTSGWLLGAAATLVIVACVYGYLIRPQILTPDVLRAIPSCLTPAQLRQPDAPCLALQSYIGAPIPLPQNPDPIAYALDSLLKLPRQPVLPVRGEAASGVATPLRDAPTVRGQPSIGATLDQIAAGEVVQVMGKSLDGGSFLVRTARAVTGWVDATLPVEPALIEQLPAQPDRILAKVVNPRWATTFSSGNPSEAAKFALYQGSMVRFGWYLSPLGVALAVVGLALLWRRLNAQSWLLLVIGSALTYTFIEQAYGTDEATYIYLLRRFVPLSYPLFCLAAAYALAAIAQVGRKPWLRLLSFGAAFTLIGFLVATNTRLYRHTEYGGAIRQISAMAETFEPDAVLLLRGGAPTAGEFRDLPDILATPLTYAFYRHALTVKSPQPGNYAQDLARYVQHWQAQGRPVYLLQSASGALPLPGLRQEKVDTLRLELQEFEQLTNQKPTNVDMLMADFAIYRLAPGDAASMPAVITAEDYGSQVRGLYRPEQFASATLAWTNGEALVRLPWPASNQAFTVDVQLQPGVRPATLGPAQVELSFRPETSFFVEDPQALPFLAPVRFVLAEGPNTLRITIDPRGTPAPTTGTFLLRIASSTWIPGRDQPGSNDGRALGVLFGGAAVQP